MHGDHSAAHIAWSASGPAGAARRLLEAVADGDERSVELASALAVLESEVVRRAGQLGELLRSRSPFALVRAVELAETVLLAEPTGTDVARAPSSGRRS